MGLPSRAVDVLVAQLADHDYASMLALCATCRTLHAAQRPLRTLVVFGSAVTSPSDSAAMRASQRAAPDTLAAHLRRLKGQARDRTNGQYELYCARDKGGGVYATVSALDELLERLPPAVQGGITTLLLARLCLRDERREQCPVGLIYAEHLTGLRQLHASVVSSGTVHLHYTPSTRLADCVLRVALSSRAALRALSVEAGVHMHTPDVHTLVRLLGGSLDECFVDLTPHCPRPWRYRTQDEGAQLQALVRAECTRPSARVVCRMDGRAPGDNRDQVGPSAPAESSLMLLTELDRVKTLCNSTSPEFAVMIYEGGERAVQAHCARRRAWIARALRTRPRHPLLENGAATTTIMAARLIERSLAGWLIARQ